ncbi:MAG: hypothetical protein KGZ83_12575 [Sulfuricella sp.]|nr:hypothetical protein [Sulfuricella sp.]
MPTPSEAELDALSAQVNDQLNALLIAAPVDVATRGTKPSGSNLPAAPAQQALIEKATGEPFETFWQKYLRHAKRDLCLPDGVLNKTWQKWRDLESREAVRVSYGWLTAMGISTASLAPVAVAAVVILLNAAVKIGLDALCEDCPK